MWEIVTIIGMVLLAISFETYLTHKERMKK